VNRKLQQFLYLANAHGYGSPEVNEERRQNGEHVITFAQDGFEFRDTYYGGEPYSGQEVIFANGRAMWAMQYRGRIMQGEDVEPIYAFLGKVLTGPKLGLPRGVDGTVADGLTYQFEMDGELDEFTAREIISRGKNVVYSAEFLGGLVDLTKES